MDCPLGEDNLVGVVSSLQKTDLRGVKQEIGVDLCCQSATENPQNLGGITKGKSSAFSREASLALGEKHLSALGFWSRVSLLILG